MKRVLILICLVAPLTMAAQKAEKPSLSKAEKSFKEGKISEAKTMIDGLVDNPTHMVDKKGQPSKDAAKTWYLRGLIYFGIDSLKSGAPLVDEPFKIAMESFKKADDLNKDSKNELAITDASGILPVTKTQQMEILANYYLDQGIKRIQQDEPDYSASIIEIEKSKEIFETALQKYDNDTLAYFVLAIAGQNAEKYDTAIAAAKDYYERGGKGKEPYLIMYQVYATAKGDKEKALEVIREAKKAMPNENQFALIELELLIGLKKEDEAKAGLEAQIAKNPDNKVLHFFLGYINTGKNNLVEAKKNFEDALKIDPKYFEAQVYLAKIMGEEAKVIKRQINSLGITPADKKKKMELDGVYVQKLKVALPYWEKAEKLNPSDEEVLSELYSIYSDLGNDAQVQRLEKRMKELGID
jgi:tetratricopeptide (TPR) repeat protein